MGLFLLPPEVQENIFSLLPLKDIISVSQTCSLFKKITEGNQFWAKVCHNQYKIKIPSSKGFARRFYRNVLYRHGHLLGFWTKEDRRDYCNGGLLQILFVDDQLRGIDLQVPSPSSNRTEPLRPKVLFNISMDEEDNDEVSIKWCISPDIAHQQDLDLKYIFRQGPAKAAGRFLRPPSWYLVTNETDIDKSNAYREDQHQRFEYLESQNKLNANDEHFLIEFVLDDVSLGVNEFAFRYYHDSYYSRLQFPRAPEFSVPIQPGMFTAISAWPDVRNQHIKWSRQLVLLSYDQDEKKVGGLLITGDSNVRAGELSFQAHLSHCCIGLDQINREVKWKDLATQSFEVPFMFLDKFPDLPDQSLAKFQGFATPMQPPRTLEELLNPPPYGSVTEEGQWIIFNQNMFGFHVTRGHPRLIICHRVEELLSQQLQSYNL